MSERIRGSYDDALYKWTYTLIYFTKGNDSPVRPSDESAAAGGHFVGL